MMPSSNRPTSDQAPSTSRSASTTRSTMLWRWLRAIRWTITSVSVVDWNSEPASTSRRRSSMALVRLPLCADREAAEGEVGEQRLHVAQHAGAGGGVARVADRGMARQALDHRAAAESVADQADRAMAVEMRAVEADDAAPPPGRDAAARAGPSAAWAEASPWPKTAKMPHSSLGLSSSKDVAQDRIKRHRTSRLRRDQLLQRLPLRRRCSPGRAAVGRRRASGRRGR